MTIPAGTRLGSYEIVTPIGAGGPASVRGIDIDGRELYTGTASLKNGPLRVLPLRKFLTELAAGNVLH